MANMSYCYFRNTRRDMNDCLDALRDEKPLSAVEVHAGRNMFLEILEFCQEQGIVDAFDDEAVQSLFAERQDHEEAEDDEEPFWKGREMENKDNLRSSQQIVTRRKSDEHPA